jgi:hypothetical protein
MMFSLTKTQMIGLWLLLITTNSSSETGRQKLIYKDPELGIQFEYPYGYSVRKQGNDLFVVKGNPENRSWVFLDRDRVSKLFSGKRAVSPESYAVHIRVKSGSFWSINAEEEVFVSDGGVVMSNLGRFGSQRAKEVKTKTWSGYKTEVICTLIDHKTGSHAAGGMCFWAIGSNGQQTFIVDTLGKTSHLKGAPAIVNTIQLLPAQARKTNYVSDRV